MAEYAAGRLTAGERADEVDGVDLDVLAVGPWLNLPPAGPSSTSSNGSPWSAAHSATMSATSRPSWSA